MSFTFVNRRINPVVAAVLRSPAHRVLSGRLALITVTGRRSGRAHTFPVGYATKDSGIEISIVAPGSKAWWRNLRSPAPVELLIKGKRVSGTGHAVESGGRVTVEVELPT